MATCRSSRAPGPERRAWWRRGWSASCLRRGPGGVTPENIVAFTFTEKAAAELKDRITRMYQETFGHVEGLAGMYVGTIHGFCLDLLQRYVDEYLKYDILDEVKQRLLIDRYYVQSGMKGLNLRRWVESRLYQTVLSLVREADADPKLLANHPARQALEQYQDLLDRHRYLDYDEILVRAVLELVTRPQVREQLRQRVKYLTVDEYQDVNPIREALIRELHDLGANLCVVGDDDQNVYEWRGSDVRHIVDFAARYPDVTQVPLELNFRSTPAVVEVARRAVEPNQQRLSKAMRSHGTRPFERGDLLCQAFADPTEEAAWVAQKIAAMRGMPYQEVDGTTRGLSWSDCAILLRSVRGSAGPFVQPLRHGRPLSDKARNGTGLRGQPEGKRRDARQYVGVMYHMAAS
jgi:DNA helicase-2/ATP-dependent DNA helicase PcrA